MGDGADNSDDPGPPRSNRWQWLARSSTWAVLYLALIPLFAVLYFLLPSNSFYHSTVRYEQGLDQDRHMAEKAIASSMTSEMEKEQKANRGWTITTIDVRNLFPAGEDFTFSVWLNVEHRYKPINGSLRAFKKSGAVRATVTAKNDAEDARREERPDSADHSSPEPRRLYVVTVANVVPPIVDGKDLFPYPETRAGSLQMPLPSTAEHQIDAYIEGYNGFPVRFSTGQFLRLLYYSAITVTTVGYGDITPITGCARFLTALEAISGIIVIGVFLNAVAREASRPKPGKPS